MDTKAPYDNVGPVVTEIRGGDAESSKATFLSTFSAEEDKAIMRKVDKRFLLLIGLLMMLKNVWLVY